MPSNQTPTSPPCNNQSSITPYGDDNEDVVSLLTRPSLVRSSPNPNLMTDPFDSSSSSKINTYADLAAILDEALQVINSDDHLFGY